jgi:hypothetical protein
LVLQGAGAAQQIWEVLVAAIQPVQKMLVVQLLHSAEQQKLARRLYLPAS